MSGVPGKAGRPPSCLCSECPTCRNRAKARNYWRRRRANGGRPLGKPMWAPKPRPTLTTDHGWLAGIIDGEGSIEIKRPHYPTPSVGVVVGMTDEAAIRRCQSIAGVGRVSSRSTRSTWKRLWIWGVYSVNAKDVLWLVLPLLTTKRARAEEALGVDAR